MTSVYRVPTDAADGPSILVVGAEIAILDGLREQQHKKLTVQEHVARANRRSRLRDDGLGAISGVLKVDDLPLARRTLRVAVFDAGLSPRPSVPDPLAQMATRAGVHEHPRRDWGEPPRRRDGDLRQIPHRRGHPAHEEPHTVGTEVLLVRHPAAGFASAASSASCDRGGRAR